MNKHVAKWQNHLITVGMDIRADGDFGPKTLAASLEVLDADEIEQTKMTKMENPSVPSFIYNRPTRYVNELIWHCAATPEGKDFTVDDIDGWHRQRGWSEIGYHFVVYRDGSIHRGRDVNKRGAHVGGHNTGSIGAVYIGGVDVNGRKAKDTRAPEQKVAMLKLTKAIVEDKRIKKISGHNQYAAKACPSFYVPNDELGNIDGFYKGKRR